MKIVITGSSGFVGSYLINLLKKESRNRVFPLDLQQADITDYQQVLLYFKKIKPDQVYHLAGFASGGGKDKELIFKVNVDGTFNILKALKEIRKPAKVLLVSTAYVYGNTSRCAREDSPIDARSFYDKSKIEMERKARKFISDDLQIVISRATNHTGPGQKLGFVVPDFCSQIAKAKSGQTIEVGNLEAQRDLFDVRDCVRAYKIVMEKGEFGEIYNIGTGKTISIKQVLEKLIKISGKKIAYKIDPQRMRPSEIAKNCVNTDKIRRLGWRAKIGLERTLKDTYSCWKDNLT